MLRSFAFVHLFPSVQDSILMTEEIFGPVLPVLTVNSCDEAISFVNSKSIFGEQ